MKRLSGNKRGAPRSEEGSRPLTRSETKRQKEAVAKQDPKAEVANEGKDSSDQPPQAEVLTDKQEPAGAASMPNPVSKVKLYFATR